MWSKYKLYFLIGFGALAFAAGFYFYKKRKKKAASIPSDVTGIPDGNTMSANETHAIQKSLAYINQN